MKKVLLIVFASFLMVGVQAQSFIGVKAGGGLGLRMGNTGPSNFTSDPGLCITGGLLYKYQILQRLNLEADVLFDMRTPTATLDNIIPEVVTANYQTYVSVPITAQLMNKFKQKTVVPYRGDAPSGYWYLEGGPYFGYGLAVDGYDPNIAESAQVGNSIDLGLVAGIGANFGFNNSYTRLNVGVRGTYGFMNTYKTYADAPVLNNASVIGYVGLDFALSKKKHFQHRW